MTLHLHRGQRTDLLADSLAQVLRRAPADPFLPDVVAVPTRGLERFLAQRLALVLGTSAPGGAAGSAASDGVCANVTFPSPDALVDQVLAQATGSDPAADPWRPDVLRWTVLTQIEACLTADWAQPLRRFLVDAQQPDGDPWRGNGRLVALATRVAQLFRSYDRERPALIRHWARGVDDDGTGTGTAVALDLAWQPHLWRLVRAAIDSPSPAEQLPLAGQALAADPDVVALPHRLSIFGPTRIPLLHLALLHALAAGRDVHLWVPDPSPARWQRLLGRLGHQYSAGGRSGHPLLRSLGRDSEELAVRLQQPSPVPVEGSAHPTPTPTPTPTPEHPPPTPVPVEGSAPELVDGPPRPDTLLGWLQHDLAADSVPPTPARKTRVLAADDRSVQVHACHGRQRQVEVLREILLGLLQLDPTLEPRDILVMCPDVATYAPLVAAAFAVGTTRLDPPARALRVRVADRTREQHNGVLTALDALLRLAAGRLSATELLDFAALTPVATRFGFDEETLARLETLVDEAGVRWGLGQPDRDRFGIPTDQNTWRRGVDRLLVGAAMSAESLHELGGTLPVDDVGDFDVARVGRLAELVDRLDEWTPRLRAPRSPEEWRDTLAGVITVLMAPPVHEQWQVSAALGALNRILADTGCDVALEFGDVRVLLAELLAGRPTRSNFRTGGLTVCSLAPMRSVPHRVICLLGLDDGTYPRPHVADGNDVLARNPQPGERNRTSEDRQVLLDAVMAATDTLVVLHTGFDEHTNERLPAAVPVLELLDTVDLTASPRDGKRVRDHVLIAHPLQPFDPRNFTRDALVPGVFSHDRAAWHGARSSVAVREPVPPLVSGPLPASPPNEVQVSDLARFLRDPPGSFLRDQLGLAADDENEPPKVELPVEMGGLDEWTVGNRVLCGLRDRHQDVDALLQAERARGALPTGRLGIDAAERIRTTASDIMAHAQPYLRTARHEELVAVDLPSGVRLVGTVGDVYGNGVTHVQFGEVRDKHLLGLWVDLLALAAMRPGHTCGGVVIGRARTASPQVGRYGVRLFVGDHDPRAQLDVLVDVMRRGQSEPLPLTPRSSLTFVVARQTQDETPALHRTESTHWGSRGDDRRERSLRRVWGPEHTFQAMTSVPAPPDERAWFPDDTMRFSVLSRRVWEPVIEQRKWLQ